MVPRYRSRTVRVLQIALRADVPFGTFSDIVAPCANLLSLNDPLKFYSRPRPLVGGIENVRRRQRQSSASALTDINNLKLLTWYFAF